MKLHKKILLLTTSALALGSLALASAVFAQSAGHQHDKKNDSSSKTEAKSSTPATPATAADYAVNKRIVIRASAEEHAFVLTEMNDFLTALHTINTAIASKDFELVAKTASAIANHSAEKPAIEVSFETKIPAEWKSFARPLRQGFGEVAQAAKQEPSVEKIMVKLAKTTQNCVACHATFKIVSPATPSN